MKSSVLVLTLGFLILALGLPAAGLTKAAKSFAVAPESLSPAAGTEPFVLRLPQAFFDHMHNKLVHFPVALGCLSVLLIFLSYRWPEFQISLRLTLFLAALGASAAVVTGKMQAGEFMNGPMSWVLHAHRKAAESTLVLLWLGAVLSFLPWAKKYMWIYALILLCMVLATGFFGGLLAAA